jgi:sporulation protein YlmC with PRC-barrel domain
MLLELSKLQNLSVGSFDEGDLIGVVKKVIIDKEDANVIGFVVKRHGFFGAIKAASFQDVVDIDRAGIVLRSAEALVDQNEIVRIAQIISSKFNLIGLRAISKEKKYLGRVYDGLIDSTTGDITRLYVKHLLNEYVFERNQIDEITNTEVRLKTEKRQRAKKQAEMVTEAKIA